MLHIANSFLSLIVPDQRPELLILPLRQYLPCCTLQVIGIECIATSRKHRLLQRSNPTRSITNQTHMCLWSDPVLQTLRIPSLPELFAVTCFDVIVPVHRPATVSTQRFRSAEGYPTSMRRLPLSSSISFTSRVATNVPSISTTAAFFGGLHPGGISPNSKIFRRCSSTLSRCRCPRLCTTFQILIRLISIPANCSQVCRLVSYDCPMATWTQCSCARSLTRLTPYTSNSG